MAYFKCPGCHEWRFIPKANLESYFAEHFLCKRCVGWEKADWGHSPTTVLVLVRGERILFHVRRKLFLPKKTVEVLKNERRKN